jgi:hypothetical protein
MDIDTQHRFMRFPFRAKRERTPDYKERLQRSAKAPGGMNARACDARPGSAGVSCAAQVQALARHAQVEGLAYQSVVVAALQTVDRVLARQHQAAAASLSLAQGEKLHQMIATLERVREALQASLSQQGAKMLGLAAERTTPGEESQAWWFSLSEAIQALEEGIDWMKSVVSGQPRGGPARTLSMLLTHLFTHQHEALLKEAAEWVE